jgi:hypothetical protein
MIHCTFPTGPRWAYTTQPELREAFWDMRPDMRRVRKLGPRGSILPQNSQPAIVRLCWCDWIDHLEESRQISPALAARATL